MKIKDTILRSAARAATGKVVEGIILATGEAIGKATKDITINVPQTRIAVPKSAAEYRGKDYEVIVEELRAYGFESFGLLPIKDLINGKVKKDGSIEKITINGSAEFKANTKFPPDAHVVIEYHTFRKPR